MGRPPACLFVVRHGLRLDAADKQWHLSSPTPYDPPLTYNGWLQAKSLGVRINTMIRDLVSEEEAAAKLAPDGPGKRKRKKYKVVIHSSPFLRCIQTSIAISAGLATDSTPFGAWNPTQPKTQTSTPSPPILSPRSRPTILPDDREPVVPKPVPIRRSVLRLDAFLGEWLSPDYFELITPPPASVMMVASARADLLRREDYTSYPNFSAHTHSNSQGHLWSPGGSMSTSAPGSTDPFDNIASLSSPLHRSGSTHSQTGYSRQPSTATSSCESTGYVSPVPHYAVSNNNTIPPGYVAHARDACVDVDYQWDSMRPPLDWVDGGTFPEQWAAMHKRFRKGIQHLVDWYSTTENPTDMVTKTAPRFARKESIEMLGDLDLDDGDDVEVESIVIMVSHGAGCNALIGAITHEPVLTDVGMASLTMAVRKPEKDESDSDKDPHHVTSPGWASPERRKGMPPVYRLYDLKMLANTDHLRPLAPTPSVSRSPSVTGAANGARGRFPNFNNFSFNDGSSSRSSSANAALSSLRRGEGPSSRFGYGISNGNGNSGITVGSGVLSFSKPTSGLARTPSIGLWSPASASNNSFGEDDDDDEDNMLPNFGDTYYTTESNATRVSTPPLLAPKSGDMTAKPSPAANGVSDGDLGATTPLALQEASTFESSSDEDAGPGGLWGGGPPPPDDADRYRDLGPTKRRWTTTERSTERS